MVAMASNARDRSIEIGCGAKGMLFVTAGVGPDTNSRQRHIVSMIP